MTVEQLHEKMIEEFGKFWKALSDVTNKLTRIEGELNRPDPEHCVQKGAVKELKDTEVSHDDRLKELERFMLTIKTIAKVVGFVFSLQFIGTLALFVYLLNKYAELVLHMGGK